MNDRKILASPAERFALLNYVHSVDENKRPIFQVANGAEGRALRKALRQLGTAVIRDAAEATGAKVSLTLARGKTLSPFLLTGEAILALTTVVAGKLPRPFDVESNLGDFFDRLLDPSQDFVGELPAPLVEDWLPEKVKQS